MKSLAWQKIADHYSTNVDCVKRKMNVLRTQLGREVNLERIISTGQKTEDLYVSQSMGSHYKEMKYLILLIGEKSKSRDTMKVNEKQEEMKPSTTNSVAEKKLELVAQATKALLKHQSKKVYQTLQNMSAKSWQRLIKATRMIAEKRINDLLFEAELNAFGTRFKQK